MRTIYVLLMAVVLASLQTVFTTQWTYQQSLFVPYANATYGLTPPLLVGRGFLTLVSGYDPLSPGIFVHTTDDGYVRNGKYVWSQQAVLKPLDTLSASDMFGRTMVSFDQTLIVAAPNRINRRGAVFVFNGTLRHWFQVQRLTAPETTDGDLFGESLALHNDRLIIGAKGQTSNGGAAYVYERPSGGMYWSRTARLIPRDQRSGGFFAQKVALYTDVVAVYANNDNPGDSITSATVETSYSTGSAYLFTGSAGTWSQQQKLVATDFVNYRKGGTSRENLDLSLGSRILGPSIAVNKDTVALGVVNVNASNPTKEAVYIFNGTSATRSWSLQQKLFAVNDSEADPYAYSNVTMDAYNTLIATLPGQRRTTAYVFKSFGGSGWSLQQKLRPFDEDAAIDDSGTVLPYPNGTQESAIRRNMDTQFFSPAIWGGNLLFNAGPHGGVQIRSQLTNRSCLLIWMSDHFLDGWDTAVLTVRAPDLTNDTFHPHCDQVDPFLVRYCPYQPSDEGVYIVKVFAATQARFFWEMSWQVTIEDTGKTYKGDFGTRMEFNFNSTSSSFSLVQIQNEVFLDSACFRCTRVASLSWTELQVQGNSAFWPLVVTGAPYYISDYEGYNLTSAGRVCNGITTFECYQTMSDGLYVLRLGGGSFGRLTGFPSSTASWSGCGESGGLHDQLVFRIGGSKCTAVQKFTYTSRCSLPPPITSVQYANAGFVTTPSPSFGGTVMPTENVFGLGSAGGANSYLHRQRGARNDPHLISEHELLGGATGAAGKYDAERTQDVPMEEYFGSHDNTAESPEPSAEEVDSDSEEPVLSGFELVAQLLKSRRALEATKETEAEFIPEALHLPEEPPLTRTDLNLIFKDPDSDLAYETARNNLNHIFVE